MFYSFLMVLTSTFGVYNPTWTRAKHSFSVQRQEVQMHCQWLCPPPTRHLKQTSQQWCQDEKEKFLSPGEFSSQIPTAWCECQASEAFVVSFSSPGAGPSIPAPAWQTAEWLTRWKEVHPLWLPSVLVLAALDRAPCWLERSLPVERSGGSGALSWSHGQVTHNHQFFPVPFYSLGVVC